MRPANLKPSKAVRMPANVLSMFAIPTEQPSSSCSRRLTRVVAALYKIVILNREDGEGPPFTVGHTQAGEYEVPRVNPLEINIDYFPSRRTTKQRVIPRLA